MGEGENHRDTNMIKTAIISCLIAASVAAPQKDLPVLFQFKQPTHDVAVFRGANLKNAIAKGLVKGFGGVGAGASGAARDGKSVLVASRPLSPPVVHRVASPPVVRVAPVVHTAVHAAPVLSYQPTQFVSYKPAPVPTPA